MFQNLSKSRKEMEELSAALESLINGEEPALDRVSEDTLPSKIRSQILRLNDKMRGSEQALLQEREEIRGLIADTAHQLRTPLANMESYLSLLKADLERRTGTSESIRMEDQAYYIRAIAESEEKIRFLTESFIRMARLENGIIQIRKDSRDMEGTLLGSILQAKKAADEKQIEIRLTMSGESGRTKKMSGQEKEKEAGSAVLHDPQWLGEAVFNLLDNSIKYSPEGSTIYVSTVKNEMFFRIQHIFCIIRLFIIFLQMKREKYSQFTCFFQHKTHAVLRPLPFISFLPDSCADFPQRFRQSIQVV